MNNSIETISLNPNLIHVQKGFNARKAFDKKGLNELAQSITEQGILQPLVVRADKDGNYQLVIGERRLRASKIAKIEDVPCIVKQLDDAQAIAAMTIENLQRKDLSPLEEAEGIDRLLLTGISAEDAARQLGRSATFVRRRNSLNLLTKDWKKCLDYGGINLKEAEMLARLAQAMQKKIKDHADERSFNNGTDELGRVYYHHIENSIDSIERDLANAPFSLEDAELVRKAGACAVCPKRAACNPDLFQEKEHLENTCLDFECYQLKLDTFMDQRFQELQEKHGQEPVLVSDQYYGNDENALSLNAYDVVKKSDEGAEIALYSRGDKIGKQVYIKRTSSLSGSGPMTDEQKIERKKVIRDNKIEALSKSLSCSSVADAFGDQLGKKGQAVEAVLNFLITDTIGFGQSKAFIEYFTERYNWKQQVDYEDHTNRRNAIKQNIEETPMKLKFPLFIDAILKMKTVSDYDSSSMQLVKLIECLDGKSIKKEATKVIDTPKPRKKKGDK